MELIIRLRMGAGTGSSASFLVCLAALLVQFVKTIKKSGNFCKQGYKTSSWDVNLKEFSKKELNIICNWAFNAERIMHGTPSGIDNTICTYGSIVEFRKGFPLKLVPVKTTLRILLINSNIPRDTKVIVAKVAALRQKYPSVVESIFNAIENIATLAVDRIRTLPAPDEEPVEHNKKETLKIYEDLVTLASMNQNLLVSLGVSHSRLEEIVQILLEYDLHGKITGAGGGGYALALIPPSYNDALLANVEKVLTTKGFGVHYVTVGGRGVAVE